MSPVVCISGDAVALLQRAKVRLARVVQPEAHCGDPLRALALDKNSQYGQVKLGTDDEKEYLFTLYCNIMK